ncbi:glycosyltransferase [Dyella sp. C9]|uniref:glycosyltransferase n=1 Tax=Dyella sp. C9 TaxID=2202154 RepID=UPI000DF00B08|nr:glycosyltransferase [Dyella sp. C9]
MNAIQVPAPPLARAAKPYARTEQGLASGRPYLSLVICTLNEHEAIGDVLRELSVQLEGMHHEIIVVDDSTDERTADVVRMYGRDVPTVRLLRRQGGSGLSSAAIAGWDIANGRYLAIMDGDGQHDPAMITALLDKLDDPNVDVAVASRYLEDSRSGLGRVRHGMSRAGVLLTDSLLGVRLADPLSGCFAMTREWYQKVRSQLSGLGFKILIDVVASGTERPRTAQVPTLLRTRIGGESKMDTRVVLDLIMLLVEKRTRGRLTAKTMVRGIVLLGTLLAQWASLVALLAAGCPLWASLLISVMVGLTGHLLVRYALTPKALRPRNAREALGRWLRFYRGRWSDLPLNAGAGMALCLLSCPAPVAILVGVLLAESRYDLVGSTEQHT